MLSFYSLTKQFARHRDFMLSSYEEVEWILENGEVIVDVRENVLHFVGDTRGTCGYRTKVTVKAARSRDAIFLTSAHRLRERDYERLKRQRRRAEN